MSYRKKLMEVANSGEHLQEVAVGALHIAEGGGVKLHGCLIPCDVFPVCDVQGERELRSDSRRLHQGGRNAHRGVALAEGVSSHRRVVPS